MNLLKQLFGKEKPADNDEVVKLSRMLIYVFSLDELRDLCANLGVRFENLPGGSKDAKAKELVLYFSQPPRSIDEFIQACSQLHLHIPWNDPDSIVSQPHNRDRVRSLLQLINYCFNVNELRDLCLDLGMDYDNIAGSNEVGELVSFFERRGRIPELIKTCMQLHPDRQW